MTLIPRHRSWDWNAPSTRPPRGRAFALVRRGVRHGTIRPAGSSTRVADPLAAWAASRPVLLPGALSPLEPFAAAIRRSRGLFGRAREGTIDFQREVWQRLRGNDAWEAAGAAVDLFDDREIEKVFADERRNGRWAGRDLWAKLSWISRDPRDESVRIRFSFGSEFHEDWHRDPARARAADRLAAAVFPECALLAENVPLDELLTRLVGRAVRLSERIAFANAPGGGAPFHHDHEPGQRGVVFGQLAGRTAWLALPKRELAELLPPLARGRTADAVRTPARALRALDRHDVPGLDALLNASPRLTGTLVRHGALHVLSAGDVLLLPSHGPDDVAWHSVFALGARPSLGHSYGIFAARRDTTR